MKAWMSFGRTFFHDLPEKCICSLGMMVIPSPKIIINLLRTYEKLPCKGSAVRKIPRYIQSEILLLYHKDKDRNTPCFITKHTLQFS